jgi:hypothetical protein
MQADTINVNVDTLNDTTTIVPETYTRYDEYQNRSVYIGENHALDARDTVSLYRTFPKVNGNFKGVSKSAIKLTKDFSVDGVDGVSTLTAPFILDISFSIPVGVSAADVLIIRQRALAFLDSDTVMDALNNKLMV